MNKLSEDEFNQILEDNPEYLLALREAFQEATESDDQDFMLGFQSLTSIVTGLVSNPAMMAIAPDGSDGLVPVKGIIEIAMEIQAAMYSAMEDGYE